MVPESKSISALFLACSFSLCLPALAESYDNLVPFSAEPLVEAAESANSSVTETEEQVALITISGDVQATSRAETRQGALAACEAHLVGAGIICAVSGKEFIVRPCRLGATWIVGGNNESTIYRVKWSARFVCANPS